MGVLQSELDESFRLWNNLEMFATQLVQAEKRKLIIEQQNFPVHNTIMEFLLVVMISKSRTIHIWLFL